MFEGLAELGSKRTGMPRMIEKSELYSAYTPSGVEGLGEVMDHGPKTPVESTKHE